MTESKLGPVSSSGDDKLRRPTLGRDTRQTILAVGLSAVVSFAVASYTVQSANDTQKQEAERTRLGAVYMPLNDAVSGVLACVNERLCSESQLLRASREFNKRALSVNSQGSDTAATATFDLEESLRVIVQNRLGGKPQPDALLRRAVDRAAVLQRVILRELAE